MKNKILTAIISLSLLVLLSSCGVLTDSDKSSNVNTENNNDTAPRIETMNININGQIIEVNKDDYRQGEQGTFGF